MRTTVARSLSRTLEANEEFMALWLQELEQPDLPWHCHGILCVLATAQQALNGHFHILAQGTIRTYQNLSA